MGTLLAGIRTRQVEAFEGLQPLIDLAEGDLDGSETVVHAAEVVTDHGDLAGEVGLDGSDLGGEVDLDGSEIRTQIVDARVDVVEACVELDGEQSRRGAGARGLRSPRMSLFDASRRSLKLFAVASRRSFKPFAIASKRS